MKTLRLENVSFSYNTSDKTLMDDLSLSMRGGWSGLIGANGCGKSTLLKILAGELEPSSGRVIGRSSSFYYCLQETIDAPEDYQDFCAAFDNDAMSIKSSLGLHDFNTREWDELSQGEQKRTQLGCALWRRPDLLLIDEPTNHLDAPNRTFIMEALRDYKGIGVLVSHDRDLLNALCYQCLFFVGEQVQVFAGGYDTAKAEYEAQTDFARKQKATLQSKSDSLKEEVKRLQALAQKSDNRLSKRGISRKDHDSKARIDLARLGGKDKSFDQKKLNITRRMDKLQSDADTFKTAVDYSGSIFFDDEVQISRVLFHSTTEKIALPDASSLHLPELTIRSGDKVGIVGANGVGKTTLLKAIMEQNSLKSRKIFFLRQELSKADIESLQKRFRELRSEDYSRCLQIIGRLGSDPTQLMKSAQWSSGETRKLAIALAIVEKFELLILDEPTNHLDLPSITNLENALAKSPLALLIVSHDSHFIKTVCSFVWEITKQANGDSILNDIDMQMN